MAALNQEGFTLATDDTIEELQKHINTSQSMKISNHTVFLVQFGINLHL